jgi:hypothetical protein
MPFAANSWPPLSTLSALKGKYPNAAFFVAEDTHAKNIACIENGRCMLFYEGETTPRQKVAILAQIKQAGYTGFENGVLIDFSRFTGVIDWEYAKRQENIVPGFPPPPKIAYVAHNEQAAMTAKGILSFSKNVEWKVCRNLAEARCWLGWD